MNLTGCAKHFREFLLAYDWESLKLLKTSFINTMKNEVKKRKVKIFNKKWKKLEVRKQWETKKGKYGIIVLESVYFQD